MTRLIQSLLKKAAKARRSARYFIDENGNERIFIEGFTPSEFSATDEKTIRKALSMFRSLLPER